MNDLSNDPNGEYRPGVFWAWASAVYARPGVADSLLAAQDRAGLNVNIALWACWTATLFDNAPKEAIVAAVDAVGDWNAGVTKPLRAARRAAKPFEDDPDYPGARDIRKAIKAAELDAERAEIGILERLAFRVLTSAPDGGAARAEKNLTAYAAAAHADAPPALLRNVIDHIFAVSQKNRHPHGERDPS